MLWATEYIKEAAGYKAVLRDATKAFNEFAGSKLHTVPSVLSVRPRLQHEWQHAANSAPFGSLRRKVFQKVVSKLDSPGPHQIAQRIGQKTVSGVELRDIDQKLVGANKHMTGEGRDFSPVGVAGHELAHSHQLSEAHGASGPTKALESMTPMPPGTLAYNKATRKGVVGRMIGRAAKFLPPLPSLNMVPGVRSDLRASLRFNQIPNHELQADRVSAAFSEYLKTTDPELYASLTSRLNRETSKYNNRLLRMRYPQPEGLGSGAYIAASRDPEIREMLVRRVRGAPT